MTTDKPHQTTRVKKARPTIKEIVGHLKVMDIEVTNDASAIRLDVQLAVSKLWRFEYITAQPFVTGQ